MFPRQARDKCAVQKELRPTKMRTLVAAVALHLPPYPADRPSHPVLNRIAFERPKRMLDFLSLFCAPAQPLRHIIQIIRQIVPRSRASNTRNRDVPACGVRRAAICMQYILYMDSYVPAADTDEKKKQAQSRHKNALTLCVRFCGIYCTYIHIDDIA